jgi:ABC-2 type transport system ATP-binding protein
MIRADLLTKKYGDTLALDRLSLEVPAGAVFGLLGPNGAGKTTFLRLAMGFVFPDSGHIDRGGLRPADIGYLSERAFYPPRFSIRTYLDTMARLSGMAAKPLRRSVDSLLEQVGLDGVANRRLGSCSRGMLQRLGLAQALLGDPALLILDEPVLGLDPAGQKFMRDQILALSRVGKSVLLSSHHLDEVTRVCSHVAVIKDGRLVRCGPLETILAPQPQVTIRTGPLPEELRARLGKSLPHISLSGDSLTLTGEAVAHKAQILRLLLDAGVDIRHLEELHSTLEEVYLEATGG